MMSLWMAFARIYGNYWAANFGEFSDAAGRPTATVETWRRALRGVPTQNVARGLQLCVQGHMQHPRLDRFMELCRAGAPCHQYFRRALPAKKSDLETGESGIRGMREALRGRRVLDKRGE